MEIKTLSDKQRELLDFQVKQTYESFNKASNTKYHHAAIWNKELFLGYRKSLIYAAGYSEFGSLKRDDGQKLVFDKYILHLVLGDIPSCILEENLQVKDFRKKLEDSEQIKSFPNIIDIGDFRNDTKSEAITYNKLKVAIDNIKTQYKEIESMAISLADKKDFSTIVNAMSYVMQKYQTHEKGFHKSQSLLKIMES